MKNNQPLHQKKNVGAVLLLVAVAVSIHFAGITRAQAQAIDPAATKLLKKMTDCVKGLEQFGVYTQSTLEELTEAGHRIDLDVSARAIIRRPNKIISQRRGDLVDQNFYYDGKTLTLENPADQVYATVRAPQTIDGTLDFVREKLELIIPVSDLVYSDPYPLLIQDVTHAEVVGKAVIDGTACDHLLFSRPGVDFQVWVADSGRPLPMKFVVTDTGTAQLLSLSTVMSNWQVDIVVPDSEFEFEPRKDYTPIAFLPLITTGSTDDQP